MLGFSARFDMLLIQINLSGQPAPTAALKAAEQTWDSKRAAAQTAATPPEGPAKKNSMTNKAEWRKFVALAKAKKLPHGMAARALASRRLLHARCVLLLAGRLC